MANRKVHVGSQYHYLPVMIDRIHPPIAVGLGKLHEGDIVRVVNMQGCPKANTMGHAHFASLDGIFGGLVCTNSLVTRKEYIEYLKMKIAEHETAAQ